MPEQVKPGLAEVCLSASVHELFLFSPSTYRTTFPEKGKLLFPALFRFRAGIRFVGFCSQLDMILCRFYQTLIHPTKTQDLLRWT